MIRALNRFGYQGPLSIEWEDSGMNREWGAPEALKMIKSKISPPPMLPLMPLLLPRNNLAASFLSLND